MKTIDYTPPPTIARLIASESFYSFIIGPVGCVPRSTEFLTPHGWKAIGDYVDGDLVAVWDEPTKQVKFEAATYVNLPAPEPFHTFDTKSLSMVLSPEHKVPYYDYRGDFQVCTARTMADKPSIRNIPTTFTLGRPDAPISDDEIRLRIAFSADGHVPNAGHYNVVTVRKERKKVRLRWLLDRNELPFTETVYPSRPTETVFRFKAAWLDKGLDFIWGLSTRQLAVVVDECTRWDGLNEHAERRYYTTVKAHADAIQFAAHASGLRASLASHDDPRNPDWATQYTVYIRTDGSSRNTANVSRITRVGTVEPEDGRKYCFTTSTGYFVARHNDTVFITGNSSKTTGIMFKILYHATRQEPSPVDGIRRTRFVVVRNTMPQLRDTTISSFMTWFKPGEAGEWQATKNNFVFKFGDVECEVLFRPLDTADDVQRVLSLEVTGAVLDEFVDIPKEIVEALSARCGRFPSALHGGATWWGMWGASNPGNQDSWWYDWLDIDGNGTRPANMNYFEQPSGLSPDAENIENLPGKRNYYTNLMVGKTTEWINQFIHVRWGYSLSGTPVFKMFNRDLHVAKHPLQFNPWLPLVIGFDAGLTPSAIFGQQDANGRINVLHEITSENTGARRFCREYLKPALATKFPGLKSIILCADPAVVQRSQTDEKSVLQILEEELQIKVHPAYSNTLADRIDAVDNYLSRLTEVGPAYLVDPSCKVLINGFTAGYRYSRNTKGVTSASPEKNKYSHPHDANQYMCMAFFKPLPASPLSTRARVPVQSAKNIYALPR